MMPDAWPLNFTKLAPPRVTPALVARPHLAARLDRGVTGPLTLVCASAGYGKTTLVSAWFLERKAQAPATWPAAWLALDEYDGDLLLFLRYFCAAVRTLFPAACPQTLALLSTPQAVQTALLVATLGSELAALPQDFILVLEDFHLVGGLAVADLLAGLARHWPAPLHLVLLTRRDPPLPLATLRARGQLAEIRTHDLRFTTDEIAAFARSAFGQAASPALLEALERQTEGWAVGLHLATLALGDDPNAAAVAALVQDDRGVADYLADELLSQLPSEVMAFLLETAQFSRFSVALYAALTDDPDGERSVRERHARTCIEWLERANFLVVTLDQRRQWFRYHHLLQDLLRRRAHEALGTQRIAALHRYAAGWLAAQGQVEEALQAALAIGDLELAAGLMEQQLCEVLNRDDPATLQRWLGLLPTDFRRTRPGLLLIEAWVRYFSSRWLELATLLPQVEAALAGTTSLPPATVTVWTANLLILRACLATLTNRPDVALTCAQQVLDQVPPGWTFVCGLGHFYRIVGRQALGHGAGADEDAWAHFTAMPVKSDAYALRVVGGLCFSTTSAGRLARAYEMSQVHLENARRGQRLLDVSWSNYFLGLIQLEWNELETAAEFLESVAHLRYNAHSHTARNGLVCLVRTYVALGDRAKAERTVALLSTYDFDVLGYESPETLGIRALAACAFGDTVTAWRWLDAYTDPVANEVPLWYKGHQLQVRLWLARGLPGDLRAALAKVESLAAIAESVNSVFYLVGLLALRAVALDALGDETGALADLRRAVTLGEPGGFIRSFADAGPRLSHLLARLAADLPPDGPTAGYLQRILAALPKPDATPATYPTVAATSSPTQHRAEFLAEFLAESPVVSPVASPVASPVEPLVEPLTLRELDVLALMQRRLSSKEIAAQLGISPATVDRHASNVYGKLGVNKRREAVARAERLGILRRA